VLTHLLSESGFSLPQRLVNATRANRKGHFEPELIVKYNEMIAGIPAAGDPPTTVTQASCLRLAGPFKSGWARAGWMDAIEVGSARQETRTRRQVVTT
jgi:hypothetical protein